MNKIKTFEEFLLSGSAQFSLLNFSVNLFLTAILAYLLSLLYSTYGNSLSNRKSFGKNFVILAVTTMIIITIVKSSLALSLGLVGALSIVRFRTAVKEPEELSFLFLNIAIGLGFGADQKLATITGVLFISGFLLSRRFLYKESVFESQNMILTISSKISNNNLLKEIIEVLKKNCIKVDIKRFDENHSEFEVTFILELDDLKNLTELKNNLKKLIPDVSISFIDNNISL